MDPILAHLLEQERTLVTEADALRTRAASEDGITEAEHQRADALRTELRDVRTQIQARAEELSERATALAAATAHVQPGTSSSRSGPTYSRSGSNFCADVIGARSGDSGAAERIARAHQEIYGAYTDTHARADGTTTSTVGAGIYPTGYRPDLLIALPDWGARISPRWQGYALDGPRPFSVPIETTMIDGQVPGEDTPATPQQMGWTDEIVSPSRAVGSVKLTREMVDGAIPSANALAADRIMRAVARKVERDAVTFLRALTGTGTGTSDDTPDALGDAVLAAAATIMGFTQGDLPTAVYVDPTTWAVLAQAKDADGRPLYWSAPGSPVENAPTSGGQGLRALEIAGGLPVIATPYLDATEMWVVDETELRLFTGSLASMMYQVNSSHDLLEAWTYKAYQAVNKGGLVKVTITPTP